jgi:hypothetical protein
LPFAANSWNDGRGGCVLFQTGKTIGEVTYEDFGTPDPAQLQAFVTEAVNKVAGKPTTTPTTF